MNKQPKEILLSQRFLPEIGGSIRWLSAVYSRWGVPVEVVTHAYNANKQSVEDSSLDLGDNIILCRRDILMDDWGIDSVSSLLKYWRTLSELRRLMKSALSEGRSLRVHCARLVPEAFCVAIAKRLFWPRGTLSCDIVSYLHGEEVLACESSKQLSLFLRWTAPKVDLLIANSIHSKKLVEKYRPEGVIEVIPPGIEYSELKTLSADARREWRKELEFPEDSIVLVSLGRLEERKNFGRLIQAISDLKNPKLQYVLIGEGLLKEKLKQQAETLGVSKQLRFLGRLDEQEKLRVLGGADIFAMPSIASASDTEGFGIVFLEAAAAGLPTISGIVGGQPEAVLDGETGFCVDGRDQEQLNLKLQALVEDSTLREKFGREGKKHAERFDWSLLVPKVKKAVSQYTHSEISN